MLRSSSTLHIQYKITKETKCSNFCSVSLFLFKETWSSLSLQESSSSLGILTGFLLQNHTNRRALPGSSDLRYSLMLWHLTGGILVSWNSSRAGAGNHHRSPHHKKPWNQRSLTLLPCHGDAQQPPGQWTPPGFLPCPSPCIPREAKPQPTIKRFAAFLSISVCWIWRGTFWAAHPWCQLD